MIDIRAAFPNAHEKNRRTVRGRKPTRYVVNAPALNSIVGKVYSDVTVSHEEAYRGYRHHWYLVQQNNQYGYIYLREHDKSPFENSCLSMDVLQRMCRDIEFTTRWYGSVKELVNQEWQRNPANGIKNGTNNDFIEIVKKKFPEQFAPQPKPVSTYSPYYSFNDKSYKSYYADNYWEWNDYDNRF
jgi:hypothetical protein